MIAQLENDLDKPERETPSEVATERNRTPSKTKKSTTAGPTIDSDALGFPETSLNRQSKKKPVATRGRARKK